MTTKRPMGSDNISKIISSFGKHIFNINKALKNIKFKILADFVYTDYWGFIIMTNKITSQSDLNQNSISKS